MPLGAPCIENAVDSSPASQAAFILGSKSTLAPISPSDWLRRFRVAQAKA